MFDFLAYCAKCGEFVGVDETCLDTRRQLIFYTLDCEHIVSVSVTMMLYTKREFKEVFPEEEEMS